jgi:hypothetical protein
MQGIGGVVAGPGFTGTFKYGLQLEERGLGCNIS